MEAYREQIMRIHNVELKTPLPSECRPGVIGSDRGPGMDPDRLGFTMLYGFSRTR